jgi:glycerol-3-phosphate acyltransferase PlsY
MMEYLLVFGAYLVGSIPFGLVLGKAAGVDVRGAGSGNIGATNVARLVGKKLGVLTLVCDALKAVLPMLAAGWLLEPGSRHELWVALSGGAAFLGHLYPVYLKFKGGKGVATALGIFLYLSPLAAVIDVLIFVGVVYNWGYVSLGSLTAALMMPGLVWLLTGSLSNSLLALAIGVLIWVKHRDNIERLMHHKEKSWRKDPSGQDDHDQR